MGQAKRRGTFEQRRAAAIERQEKEQSKSYTAPVITTPLKTSEQRRAISRNSQMVAMILATAFAGALSSRR